ncbi:IS66 family insertion sequence element accessory protein TnpB [Bradyrhizobium sp. STM 3562]|uniref:IS66 family insertion sequence element accessory protein TnpB n=1 Tax=Bradyrhizobium sp. STM 3562 TaxID=578924 RepID=UPI003890440E
MILLRAASGSGSPLATPTCVAECKAWALAVQESLKRDPHAGDLYIFRRRRGDLIKMLWRGVLQSMKDVNNRS